MKLYEVVVGNVGTVYRGTSHNEACSLFWDYKVLSEKGDGRAAGEPVTVLEDGEPIREYRGKSREE